MIISQMQKQNLMTITDDPLLERDVFGSSNHISLVQLIRFTTMKMHVSIGKPTVYSEGMRNVGLSLDIPRYLDYVVHFDIVLYYWS